MDKHIEEDDFQQVRIICNDCNQEMLFSSTDEEGDMFFLVYECEKCNKTIWILDNEKRYLKSLSEYMFNNKIC